MPRRNQRAGCSRFPAGRSPAPCPGSTLMWGRRMTSPPRIGGRHNRRERHPGAERRRYRYPEQLQYRGGYPPSWPRMCWPRSTRVVFISGVKVSAKAADETDSPHPRKPFAPGQRRQRPGKFGKKTTGSHLGQKSLQRIAVKRASSFRGQSAGSAGTTPPLFLGGAAKAYDGASEIRQAWTRGRKRRAARHLLVYGQ